MIHWFIRSRTGWATGRENWSEPQISQVDADEGREDVSPNFLSAIICVICGLHASLAAWYEDTFGRYDSLVWTNTTGRTTGQEIWSEPQISQMDADERGEDISPNSSSAIICIVCGLDASSAAWHEDASGRHNSVVWKVPTQPDVVSSAGNLRTRSKDKYWSSHKMGRMRIFGEACGVAAEFSLSGFPKMTIFQKKRTTSSTTAVFWRFCLAISLFPSSFESARPTMCLNAAPGIPEGPI
jgi:hypothetical protein